MADRVRVLRVGQTAGDALRDYCNGLQASAGDELADVIDAGLAAAELLDRFVEAVDRDRKSGELTDAGVQARRRTHGEVLIFEAEKLERLAAKLERNQEATFESEMARLSQPAGDVLTFLRLQDLQHRLEREDPLIVGTLLERAAESGEADELLRAALTIPAPPLNIGTVGEYKPSWRPLVTPDVRVRIEKAIRARLSPQGPMIWRIRELRNIAAMLRRYVTGEGTPTTFLEDLARTGTAGA